MFVYLFLLFIITLAQGAPAEIRFTGNDYPSFKLNFYVPEPSGSMNSISTDAGHTYFNYNSYSYHGTSRQLSKNNKVVESSANSSESFNSLSTKCPSMFDLVNYFQNYLPMYLQPFSYQFNLKKESLDRCDWYQIKCFYSFFFDKSCYYKHLGECDQIAPPTESDTPNSAYVSQIRTPWTCSLYQVECASDSNLSSEENGCRHKYINNCSDC